VRRVAKIIVVEVLIIASAAMFAVWCDLNALKRPPNFWAGMLVGTVIFNLLFFWVALPDRE